MSIYKDQASAKDIQKAYLEVTNASKRGRIGRATKVSCSKTDCPDRPKKATKRLHFRPFAPSVLVEDAAEWFELDRESPYMLLVADVLESRRRPMSGAQAALFGIDKLNVPRSDIPAVTHVDYSARVQTVRRDTNPRYHALLSAFNTKERTGCPVLVNTSFNVRGEPIVCTPEDAFRCFMGTEIEALAIGNWFLRKEAQDPSLKLDYKDTFELDWKPVRVTVPTVQAQALELRERLAVGPAPWQPRARRR